MQLGVPDAIDSIGKTFIFDATEGLLENVKDKTAA